MQKVNKHLIPFKVMIFIINYRFLVQYGHHYQCVELAFHIGYQFCYCLFEILFNVSQILVGQTLIVFLNITCFFSDFNDKAYEINSQIREILHNLATTNQFYIFLELIINFCAERFLYKDSVQNRTLETIIDHFKYLIYFYIGNLN